MRKTSRKTSGKTLITFELEPEIVEKFDTLVAERRSRSRTGQLRWMMLRAIKRAEERAAAVPNTETPASA